MRSFFINKTIAWLFAVVNSILGLLLLVTFPYALPIALPGYLLLYGYWALTRRYTDRKLQYWVWGGTILYNIALALLYTYNGDSDLKELQDVAPFNILACVLAVVAIVAIPQEYKARLEEA